MPRLNGNILRTGECESSVRLAVIIKYNCVVIIKWYTGFQKAGITGYFQALEFAFVLVYLDLYQYMDIYLSIFYRCY